MWGERKREIDFHLLAHSLRAYSHQDRARLKPELVQPSCVVGDSGTQTILHCLPVV